MNKNQKIIKTILSLIISFLIIFIAAMFARAASSSVLPSNNKVSVLINDYLDMMMQMMDKIAVKMNVKRNTVSEYQVNLISQSISDYVGYSMYQTADIVKNYNPNKSYSQKELEKYKNDYYKMTVENPYLRGMTVFAIDGKMRLNLYLSKNKSWPIELQDNLIKDIIKKGSLVLNATNENTFYIMEYIKNNYGEIIVATRNDYSYVSDIAMYYQVADKRLYVSDSRNLIYNVRESIGDNTIEKVSSVINRFAYYKKQPSFIVNDSLSVSMIGKEYPNYFELIVLALTALLILLFQLILNGIFHFFKYLMQIKNNREYLKNLYPKSEGELLENIDEDIINVKLPQSNPQEDIPPIVEKVYYKIPEEYKKINKEDKFNIKKEISNIVSNIKNGINKDKKEIEIKSENIDLEEKAEDKEENNIEMLIQNEEINIDNINLSEEKELTEKNIENENSGNNLNEIIEDISDINNEYLKFKEEGIIDEIEEEYTINEKIEDLEIKDIIDDNESFEEDEELYSIRKEINNEENLESNFDSYEDILENAENKIEENDNVDEDILNSYNQVLTNTEEKTYNEKSAENKDYNKDNAEDVFAAFDKMLSSIISKAEEDAKSIIKK